MLDRAAQVEEAWRLLSIGDVLGALNRYVALLAVDPNDTHTAYDLAGALVQLGENRLAVETLSQVGKDFAERSNLPMALCSWQVLLQHDQEQAQALLDHIVELYRLHSPRANLTRRTPPPLPAVAAKNVANNLLTLDQALASAREVLSHTQELAKRRWGGAVVPWPLFSALDEPLFRRFVSLLGRQAVQPGTKVVEEGQRADSFYLVARGTLKATRESVTLGLLRAGTFFGEMALLTKTPRQATVVAESHAELFQIDVDAMQQLAQEVPDFGQSIAAYCQKRLLDNLAQTSPLLQKLPEAERKALLLRFSAATHAPGEIILTEGQPNDALYLVLTGEIEVLRSDGNEQVPVAILGAADVFGEISLISRRPATATVRSLSRSTTLRLARNDFDTIVARHPQILASLYRLGGEREAEAEALLRRSEVAVSDDALL